jgi:transposase
MSNMIEANYSQQWLFPPSLEELLPAGHPARFVREFVDALDLEKLGFKAEVAETGRPAYSVNLQVKVILYGYMNRIRSTRGWERACLNDIGMLWLTGMNYPDHTTLWRCWNDNREGLRKLFRQLLQIATAANLVGMVLHAIDGTKILSAASEQQAWRRGNLEKKLKRLEQAINEIMKQTEQSASEFSSDAQQLPEQLQERQQLREMIQKQLAELNAQDRDHLNPQDREARVMKCGARKQFAYNAQAVVDHQSQLIVAAEVVTDESDNYQLTPMLDEVKSNLGGVAKLSVADAGYLVTTQLAESEQKGYAALVNLQEPLQDAVDQLSGAVAMQCKFERTNRSDSSQPRRSGEATREAPRRGDACSTEKAWLDSGTRIRVGKRRHGISPLDVPRPREGPNSMAGALYRNESEEALQELERRQPPVRLIGKRRTGRCD